MPARRFPVPPSARPAREAGFLAGFTLDTLIAPSYRPNFLRDHWDRTPLVLNRRLRRFYTGLLTMDEVDQAMASGRGELSCVDARDGKGRTWLFTDGNPARPATDALLSRVADGATLIMDNAQRVLPGLGRMCRLLMSQTGHAWHCNLYATPPGGQGFDGHVDDTGVFILQVQGQKTWWFGNEQIARPLAGEGGRDAPDGWLDEAQQAVLATGDMLYLPRGVPHAAAASDSSDEGSLHVTLTVSEASFADIAGVEAETLGDDDALRDLAPIGFHEDREGLASALSERWTGDATEAVEAFLMRQASRFQPEFKGRLASALKPKPVTDATETAPRDDLFWQIGAPAGEEGVRALVCGPVHLRFAERAEPALRALLTIRTMVADLPGALAETDRAALAGMLLDHALINRRAG
ncbi:MAG: cupin domain-containing protein [Pseudomonadota bacterium]